MKFYGINFKTLSMLNISFRSKTKRLTQKEILKDVKEVRYNVISFNPNGSRSLFYGNGNPLQCFYEMANESKKGLRVLLVDAEEKLQKLDPEMTSMKDTGFYEKILPLAITPTLFLK